MPPAKRVGLVTGAASGLGAAFARHLAADGCGLVLVDRQAGPMEDLARELRQKFPVQIETIAVDLTRPETPGEIIGECGRRSMAVDILVNNAGHHLNRPFLELAWPEIERNLRLLLGVVVEMTYRFLPGMIQRRWGRIINVASMSGFMPGGVRLATYNATKTFLIPFSESLNFELESTGVRATAVCPGFMRTGLFVNSGLTDVRDSVPSFMWLDPKEVAAGTWSAIRRGAPLYVPGGVNCLIAAAAKVLPRSLLRERSRIFHRAERRRLIGAVRKADSTRTRPGAALITGGSAGIGAAFAEELAGQGHDLILVARREEPLRRRAEELGRRHRVKAVGFVQDLSAPGAADALWARCAALGWPVEILVNNAGYPLTEVFHRMSWPEVEAALRLYVEAMVRLSHLALPGMVERASGRIINVSSLAAFEPGSYRSSLYSSAKAFAATFSESVAAELEGTGVAMTAVCPGFTRTEWAARNGLRSDAIPSALWMDSSAVARAGLAAARAGAPLARVATVPSRLVSAAFALAPRRLAGWYLSRRRRQMSLRDDPESAPPAGTSRAEG